MPATFHHDSVWEKTLDLSSYLRNSDSEGIDDPILDNPPSDTENTTPPSWEFFWGGGSTWSLFDNSFLPFKFSKSKGYGSVAPVNPGLYGFFGLYGPWFGSGFFPFPGNGSPAHARCVENLLDCSASSASSEFDILNFPFRSFSGSDDSLLLSLFPSLSVSFY